MHNRYYLHENDSCTRRGHHCLLTEGNVPRPWRYQRQCLLTGGQKRISHDSYQQKCKPSSNLPYKSFLRTLHLWTFTSQPLCVSCPLVATRLNVLCLWDSHSSPFRFYCRCVQYWCVCVWCFVKSLWKTLFSCITRKGGSFIMCVVSLDLQLSRKLILLRRKSMS